LDHFFPSLLKIPNFLVEFVTPIVRVSHLIAITSACTDSPAQVTKGKQRIDFFTIPEYELWLEETPDAHRWDSKYYKVSDLLQ
jgi:DNA topoisomerase-2